LPFYCITRAGRGSNETLGHLSTVFEQVAQDYSAKAGVAKKSRSRGKTAA
jgi:hypothetical protein